MKYTHTEHGLLPEPLMEKPDDKFYGVKYLFELRLKEYEAWKKANLIPVVEDFKDKIPVGVSGLRLDIDFKIERLMLNERTNEWEPMRIYASIWDGVLEDARKYVAIPLVDMKEVSKPATQLTEDEIYEGVYMDVVQLVEKDNIQCGEYAETVKKLHANYIITKRIAPTQTDSL